MIRSACLAAIVGSLCGPAFANGGPFAEKAGIVVVEIESTPTVGNWVEETIWPDYTGTSYYRWNGSNQLSNPGVAKLKYDIAIEHEGQYRLAIRNRHEDPDPSQHNDCWVKMDDGPWIKAFSNDGPGSVGAWNWDTHFEDPDNGAWLLPLYQLSRGMHTFEISGRSRHFQIDRFVLFQSYVNNPTWKGRPQSSIYTGQTDIANYCTAKSHEPAEPQERDDDLRIRRAGGPVPGRLPVHPPADQAPAGPDHRARQQLHRPDRRGFRDGRRRGPRRRGDHLRPVLVP
jgi:hypothetical protein